MQKLTSEPLTHWVQPGNADKMAKTLEAVSGRLDDLSGRKSVVAQLSTLYMIQRNEGALQSLQRVRNAEGDSAWGNTVDGILREIKDGTLDIDGLMQKCELDWRF